MMRSSKTLWDQLDNRQIIRDMLAPTDYEITETENGEEALAAIAKHHGRLHGTEPDSS
jgi:CheY-like chemotaxis protein